MALVLLPSNCSTVTNCTEITETSRAQTQLMNRKTHTVNIKAHHCRSWSS